MIVQEATWAKYNSCAPTSRHDSESSAVEEKKSLNVKVAECDWASWAAAIPDTDESPGTSSHYGNGRPENLKTQTRTFILICIYTVK